jgi:hypothetical protein
LFIDGFSLILRLAGDAAFDRRRSPDVCFECAATACGDSTTCHREAKRGKRRRIDPVRQMRHMSRLPICSRAARGYCAV